MGDREDKKKSGFARLKSFRGKKLRLASPGPDGEDEAVPSDPQQLVVEFMRGEVELSGSRVCVSVCMHGGDGRTPVAKEILLSLCSWLSGRRTGG